MDIIHNTDFTVNCRIAIFFFFLFKHVYFEEAEAKTVLPHEPHHSHLDLAEITYFEWKRVL
jgi:hypothetical protein